MKQKVSLKVIIIGDQGVGKTSLIRRFVQGKFVPVYKPTIGADFFTNEMLVAGGKQKVTLQYWDTTGQEKYRSLAKNYYKGANCCVLVYDITNNESFEHLSEWKERFLANFSSLHTELSPFVVIGNKLDLDKERKVQKTAAENWCRENQQIPFYEASALIGKLEDIFQKVAEVAWANYSGDLSAFKIDQNKPSNALEAKSKNCSC